MLRWLTIVAIVGGLYSLPPSQILPPQVAPLSSEKIHDSGQGWTYDGPMFKVLQTDTLMVAISQYRRDYQANGPTQRKLWAFPEANGIYAAHFSANGLLWNFYDFSTSSWVASDTGYLPARYAGYGDMSVVFSPIGYTYYPVFSGHDYEAGAYHPSVWWPESLSYNPFWWNENFIWDTTGAVDHIWPRTGVTYSGRLHQISTDVNTSLIYYDVMQYMPIPLWSGSVELVSTGDGPWYSFNCDPLGKTLVLTYYEQTSDHIIMLVDTADGDMWLAQSPIQKNLSVDLGDATGTPYIYGFVGDGMPFVDKDGNIRHVMFGGNGSEVVPVEIWYMFWDIKADTTHWTLIDTISSEIYYGVGINTLYAGRAQIGQNPDNGNLYVIWEQFIQDSSRFVLSSTNDTFPPVAVKLTRSTDNGVTWSAPITLLESDSAFGNHWLRYPLMSPTVISVDTFDRVIWGVYEDYDPGFAWQGQGVDSTVVLWVGMKDFPAEVSVGEDVTPPTPMRDVAMSHLPNPVRDIAHITYQIPAKTRVSLKIYDSSGRLVKNLVSGTQEAGVHNVKWDLRNQIGMKVSSGVYFYSLELNGRTLNRKLMVIK